MKPGLYGVHGTFGSGKTLFMADQIYNLYKRSNKTKNKVLVMTNIKMYKLTNTEYSEYILFNDNQFKNALSTAAIRNNNERYLNVKRNKLTKIFIFQDEAGILFNSHHWKKFENELLDFLLQCRKYNFAVYFGYQKYIDFVSQLRRHIDLNFYFKPLLNINILKPYCGSYRCNYFDFETGKTLMESYTAKDEQGDRILKERPLDFHYQFMFWKPSRWQLYDDLFINSKVDLSKIPTLWELGNNNNIDNNFDFSNVDPLYLKHIQTLTN